MNLQLVLVVAVVVATVALWTTSIASCIAFERGGNRIFFTILLLVFPIVGALCYRFLRLPALKAELGIESVGRKSWRRP
jgi:hypothetical protein